jgi:hypothetical protein
MSTKIYKKTAELHEFRARDRIEDVLITTIAALSFVILLLVGRLFRKIK